MRYRLRYTAEIMLRVGTGHSDYRRAGNRFVLFYRLSVTVTGGASCSTSAFAGAVSVTGGAASGRDSVG